MGFLDFMTAPSMMTLDNFFNGNWTGNKTVSSKIQGFGRKQQDLHIRIIDTDKERVKKFALFKNCNSSKELGSKYFLIGKDNMSFIENDENIEVQISTVADNYKATLSYDNYFINAFFVPNYKIPSFTITVSDAKNNTLIGYNFKKDIKQPGFFEKYNVWIFPVMMAISQTIGQNLNNYCIRRRQANANSKETSEGLKAEEEDKAENTVDNLKNKKRKKNE